MPFFVKLTQLDLFWDPDGQPNQFKPKNWPEIELTQKIGMDLAELMCKIWSDAFMQRDAI